MGITCSTCGCDCSTLKLGYGDKISRSGHNTTPKPPDMQYMESDSAITPNGLDNIDSVEDNMEQHGIMSIDAKTLDVLMNIDDTFSHHTNIQHQEKEESPNIPNNQPQETEINDDENKTPINNDENKTEIISSQPPVRRITTDEKDIAPTNARLTTIVNVADIEELATVIKTRYDTDDTEDDNDSSMDDAERREIEKIKSEHKVMLKEKSKVYRQGTVNPWEEEEIEDLHNEMEQQLLDLTKQASDLEINRLHRNNQLSYTNIFVASKLDIGDINNNDDDDPLPASNLYRDESSEKWKKPLIDKEKEEMRKQMVHLATLHNMSEIIKEDEETGQQNTEYD